jgi:hypothetical protein
VPVASGLHPTPDMALHRNNRRDVPTTDSPRNVERLSDCGGKPAINNDLVAGDI